MRRMTEDELMELCEDARAAMRESPRASWPNWERFHFVACQKLKDATRACDCGGDDYLRRAEERHEYVIENNQREGRLLISDYQIRLVQQQAALGTSNYLDNMARSVRYEGIIVNDARKNATST